MSTGRNLLRAEEIAQLPAFRASHPLNPDSEVRGRSLSDALGLQRVGFHLIRIAPGKEPNIYHTHRVQEEFFYILEGHGEAHIDGERFAIGPGDFMAFPTPSVAHGLRNTSDADLVYLVGGERSVVEIAEFPEVGKVLVRSGSEVFTVNRDAVETFRVPVATDEED